MRPYLLAPPEVVVLGAVQTIVNGGYLASLPATVADAQTAVLAAITELSSDSNVNSMATALLSDARDFISNATTQAIMNLSIDSKKPIGNGIITCLNKKQAVARSKKGKEAAQAVTAILSI